jgi:hypothetical protein
MKRMGFNNNQISVILESSKKKAEELQRIANEKAFLYMLAIPLNVLVDEWGEDAKEKATSFCEEVVKLYEAVQEGVVSEQQLADFLYEYAEIKIEADWLKGENEDE